MCSSKEVIGQAQSISSGTEMMTCHDQNPLVGDPGPCAVTGNESMMILLIWMSSRNFHLQAVSSCFIA